MVKNSFTLIEMMVVVTIILLISGLSLAWYGNLSKNQKLDQEIVRIRSIIESAQTNASTHNTSLCSDSSTAYTSGHEVDFTSGTVTLRPLCDTTPSPIVYQPSDQLIMVTPAATIHFDSNGMPSSSVCLPFGYIGNTQCTYINISETGLVTSGACTQCSPTYICPCT